MAIVYADRVKVRSRSLGTNEFDLENAVEGFQSFSAIGNGNQTYYGIVDANGNWEIGLGTYEADSSIEKLYRNTVISSSNGNLLVDFPIGSKNVYTTIPSSLVAPLTGSELDPVFTGTSLITADIKGSVFGDDSTILVDSVAGKIVGAIETDSLSTKKVEEDFQNLIGATATVIHNCSQSHIFYHSSISADFTANFTNLELESGKGTVVTLILSQGITPYIANAVEISGSAQSILWQNSSTAPSGNASKTDIMNFSILNDAGTYRIYGQLTSFG